MKLVQLIDEDFVNYKKPSMVLGFPHCSFKCDKECGKNVCQNSSLANAEAVDISVSKLVSRYVSNPISKSVVMQGLEPFDSFEDLLQFVQEFSKSSNDDIVIYTGYTEDEVKDKVEILSKLIDKNKLIVKYGRFIPDDEERFDPVLGVKLKSTNQYAKVIKG